MTCFRHAEVRAVGICVACGRALCSECGSSNREIALSCGGVCEGLVARRALLDREIARSFVVANWLPANIPRFGYAMVLVMVAMPLTMIPDIQPGRTFEFLRWAAGFWGLAVFFFIVALLLRPIARAARNSLDELRTLTETDSPAPISGAKRSA